MSDTHDPAHTGQSAPAVPERSSSAVFSPRTGYTQQEAPASSADHKPYVEALRQRSASHRASFDSQPLRRSDAVDNTTSLLPPDKIVPEVPLTGPAETRPTRVPGGPPGEIGRRYLYHTLLVDDADVSADRQRRGHAEANQARPVAGIPPPAETGAPDAGGLARRSSGPLGILRRAAPLRDPGEPGGGGGPWPTGSGAAGPAKTAADRLRSALGRGGLERRHTASAAARGDRRGQGQRREGKASTSTSASPSASASRRSKWRFLWHVSVLKRQPHAGAGRMDGAGMMNLSKRA